MQRVLVLVILLFGLQSVAFSQARGAYKIVGSTGIRDFVSELNEHGQRGFRLDTIAKYPISSRDQNVETTDLVGILKFEPEEAYEYDWFAAGNPNDLQVEMNRRAESGFRFREMFPFADQLCGGPPSTTDKTDLQVILDTVRASLEFSYGGIFIVERRKRASGKLEYSVATGFYGRNQNPRETLKSEIDHEIRNGFRPVAMMPFKVLNRYAVSVLLERDPGAEESSSNYEVLLSEFRFERRINQLAKNGYRLMFNGTISAKKYGLMVRSEKSAAVYEIVDSNSRRFRSRKDEMLQGAEFLFSSYDLAHCDYAKQILVLMKRPSLRHNDEIKTFRLNPSPFRGFHDQIGEESQWVEAEFELNELAKQGYTIRGVFYSQGMNLVLQRTNR